MAITLPTELDWILDLLGFQWPNVDEDKMREAAEGWSNFAAAARQYQSQGVTASHAVHGANSGEAIEAFDNAWKKFGGDGGFLEEAADAADALAIVLQVVATIVLVMKIAVIAQLIALAIEFVAAQAAAPVTLGASEAGAAAATVTTRVLVRRIITEAKQKIVQAVKDALAQKVEKKVGEMMKELAMDFVKDAAKGLGGNIATQGVKSHFGAQDGFNWTAAGKAGLKPLVNLDGKGLGLAGDKVKDLSQAGTGLYHMSQGIGKVAQGDFAEGGKQIWDGREETAKGVRELHGVRYKDKEPAAEGESSAEGGASEGGSGSSAEGGSGSSSGEGSGSSGSGSSTASSRAGGSTTSSGTGESTASSEGDGAASSRSAATPTPPPAPTTESGQAEAERARSAFG
ncbi:WXG100-like domain-containing protein [Streptomyces sp. NPDC001739]